MRHRASPVVSPHARECISMMSTWEPRCEDRARSGVPRSMAQTNARRADDRESQKIFISNGDVLKLLAFNARPSPPIRCASAPPESAVRGGAML